MPDMTIWEVYEQYRIMPNLRLHQLRVAAVARELAHALRADADLVTKAALLHDMGNIMKSDFSQFPPEFYGDHDLSYWELVKKDYAATYGRDEHEATDAIAKEMGMGQEVIELIGSMGFGRIESIYLSDNLELKICEYADQRVAPYGITSIFERLEEGRRRYESRTEAESDYGSDLYRQRVSLVLELEQKLFNGLLITPEMLTEESLAGAIESLREYVIA